MASTTLPPPPRRSWCRRPRARRPGRRFLRRRSRRSAARSQPGRRAASYAGPAVGVADGVVHGHSLCREGGSRGCGKSSTSFAGANRCRFEGLRPFPHSQRRWRSPVVRRPPYPARLLPGEPSPRRTPTLRAVMSRARGVSAVRGAGRRPCRRPRCGRAGHGRPAGRGGPSSPSTAIAELNRSSSAKCRSCRVHVSRRATSYAEEPSGATAPRQSSSRSSWWASSSSTRACDDSVTGPCAGSSRRSGILRTVSSEPRKSPSGLPT